MTLKLDKLNRLGYTQSWLDFGILTEENLNNQTEHYNASADKNSEHYRYQTFKNFLELQPQVDNNLINKLFKIIQQDSDESMARAMGLDILKQKNVSDENFNVIGSYLKKLYGDSMQKYIDKEIQYRK